MWLRQVKRRQCFKCLPAPLRYACVYKSHYLLFSDFSSFNELFSSCYGMSFALFFFFFVFFATRPPCLQCVALPFHAARAAPRATSSGVEAALRRMRRCAAVPAVSGESPRRRGARRWRKRCGAYRRSRLLAARVGPHSSPMVDCSVLYRQRAQHCLQPGCYFVVLSAR